MIYRMQIARLGKPLEYIFVEAQSRDDAERVVRQSYKGIVNGREYDEELDGSLEGKEILKDSSREQLPALQGTEEQVKWANDIRANAVEQCKNAATELPKESQRQRTLAAIYEVLAWPRFVQAEYWILNRNGAWEPEIENRVHSVLFGKVRESEKLSD